MLAATATRLDFEDPISGLEVGDRADPEPPSRWEVVEVRAASLNHHDLWTLRGIGMTEERLPVVLGCDAAGVAAGGREVILHSVIEPPDADAPSILSERFDGTHAQRVVVPSRNLIDKPAELSFEEAACLPTAWLTAYRMMFTRAELRPGDTVLVQGAGGGVSTAAILLGRAAGLRVWVTSRDREKRERAVELGAHETFEPGARLPERVAAVMETVGEATWDHSLKAVREGGAVVVSGATSGAFPQTDLRRVFFRQLRILGSTMGTIEELRALVALLATSGVRPPIDSTFGLSDARDAYARLLQGEVFGKIVLTP